MRRTGQRYGWRIELLQFGLIYLVLALINLRAKLVVTPAWFNGTLESNHELLLQFQYTNNEQSRLFQFYIPELFGEVFGLSIPHAYILQRWLFVFLAFVLFHFYLREWFDKRLAFAGVALMSAVMPLTYFNHLQESAPLLLVTFVLGLWAIRVKRPILYTAILTFGAINNETMLTLPAVFAFYYFKDWRFKSLLRLGLATVVTSLPAFLVVGAIRYVNRDRPHLGGAWHWPDNISNIQQSLSAHPLDYWGTHFLYIFFIFGALWLYSVLRYSDKPLFLRRALLMIPFFIVGHLLTGIIREVRQMVPLSYIIIPAAFFYLFQLGRADDAVPAPGDEAPDPSP